MHRDDSRHAIERAGRRRLLGLALAALSGARVASASAQARDMSPALVEIDFTDPARMPELRVVNDGVMGGVSRSALQPDPLGLVFAGEVSLENNGGFASMRGRAAFPSGTSGLALTARGDGKRYKLILRTEQDVRSPIHQCDFVADDWRTHRFSAGDFRATFRGRDVTAPPLMLSQVVEFGILIADKQPGAFRIQLRSLHAT